MEPLATTSEPYIMDSTPPVLSVGARIKDGCSFIWLPGKLPCIVRPDGHITPLDVKGDIPYLRRNGRYRDPSTQSKTTDLCGVATADGVLLAQHILPSAEHAAAVPALDADDGADSTFGADDGVPVMMIPPDEASDFGLSLIHI